MKTLINNSLQLTKSIIWLPIRLGVILAIIINGFLVQKIPVQAEKNSDDNVLSNPDPFNKQSPADAVNDQITKPTLKWGASSNTTRYEYCIDNKDDKSCNSSWISTGTKTSVVLPSLNPGTYYWQVRASNNVGKTYADGSSTAWWTFKILPKPGAFSKSGPANWAINQSITTTFSWGASSNAISYEYCINTTAKCPSSVAWISTGSATSKALDGLTPGIYYWQVRARNNTGITYANGSSTAWRSFTITHHSYPKLSPSLTPMPTSTSLPSTPTFTVTSLPSTPTFTSTSLAPTFTPTVTRIPPTPTLTVTSIPSTPTFTSTSLAPIFTPTSTSTPPILTLTATSLPATPAPTTTSVAPTPIHSGIIYYVSTTGNDSNPGNQSKPWKTIQKAANTMVAGNTVIIQNGTYNQYVDLTGSTGIEGKSGNETQGYISYIGESQDGVIIDGTGLPWSSGFMSGVVGKGKRVVNYIKISNMTIQNFAADGVEFYADKDDGTYPRAASHNIILDNLKVHDNVMGGIMFCGGEDPNSGYDFIVTNSEVFNNHGAHHGIKFSGDPRQIINGDHIHDSIIENNLVYNNDEIGIHNSSGNYNIIIKNNNVHDNGYAGIAGDQVWDSVYANNTSYSNGKKDATTDGIVLWQSRNITITGNIVYNNPRYGITLQNDLGDGLPANPIITNNVIYANKTGGLELSSGMVNALVYNNTIASNLNIGLRLDNAGTGNIIKNNILYQNTNQLWAGNGNTYDYNLYYPNISFASKGIHDISGDPMFIDFANGVLSLRNYRLKSTSPAIDAGYNLGSLVANDCDGINRPQGSGYDISAYEFSSP